MASRTLFKHMVVSAASLQGKRDHQEDRWSVDAAASEGPVAFSSKGRQVNHAVPRVPLSGAGLAVITLFDGHGGSVASALSSSIVGPAVFERLSAGDGGNNAAASSSSLWNTVSWLVGGTGASTGAPLTGNEAADGEQALRDGLIAAETQCLGTGQCDKCGTTAACSVIGETTIVTANVGDSRTVLFSNGVARALSDDHKPDRPDERQRVTAAGGVVSQRPRDCYRVWSQNPAVRFGLAMSRAIGDFSLKSQGLSAAPLLSAEPEMTVTLRDPNDQFLIAASDGVWDDLTDAEACSIVAAVREKNQQAAAAATEHEKMVLACPALALCQEAYRRGSTDNITAVVVEFSEAGQSSDVEGAATAPSSKL